MSQNQQSLLPLSHIEWLFGLLGLGATGYWLLHANPWQHEFFPAVGATIVGLPVILGLIRHWKHWPAYLLLFVFVPMLMPIFFPQAHQLVRWVVYGIICIADGILAITVVQPAQQEKSALNLTVSILISVLIWLVALTVQEVGQTELSWIIGVVATPAGAIVFWKCQVDDLRERRWR